MLCFLFYLVAAADQNTIFKKATLSLQGFEFLDGTMIFYWPNFSEH